MRLLVVLIVLTFMSYETIAQYHESRDHFTGYWENPESWDPQWNSPKDSVLSTDIHIYGFITINSSLYMAGTASDLWISDTLLVNGDLFLGNNGDLIIGEHGILIVRGSLKVVNNAEVLNRGYIIVTGDFINTSMNFGGSFVSTENPSKVFICGSVPAINNAFYPVLDCGRQTSSYSHTGCNYGDITDLSNDPVYDFFRSTCRLKAKASSNSPVCFGDTLKLSTLDSSVEWRGYQWNGPMSFTSNTQNLQIIANNLQLSGKYILTVFTEFCAGTDTTDVVINELPSITAFTNSPVCEGESILFSAAGGVFYDWQGPGSFTSNNQNPVIDPAGLPDAGYYRVRVTSADGCSDSLQMEVKINELPSFTAFTNSPVCEGESIRFSAAGGIFYDWQGPGSFTSNNQNPVIDPARLPDAGYYRVRVTSADGCSDSLQLEVTINELPSITALTNSPVCEGERIQFSAAGGVFYDWQGPGSFMSNKQNPVIDLAGLPDAGYYRVRVTSADGCSDSLQMEVKINKYPVADAGIDQKLENVFEARLNALTVPTDSGEWSVISGSGIILDPSAPVSDVNELAPGINEFRWRVWNGKCESTDDVIITVNDLFIPSVITPNGDGKNDFFRIEGIEENAELTIMNRWGVVEYESSDYKNDWNGYGIQNKLLPDDTYFYVLRMNNGLVCKGSLLIKRR